MKENCKYRLPCGWCDMQNKKCDMKIPTVGIEKPSDLTVTKIDVTEKHYDTAISSYPKKCGRCEHAEVITAQNSSDRLTFRCLETGRTHFYDDCCDNYGTIMAEG